jgi:hypothetical protein
MNRIKRKCTVKIVDINEERRAKLKINPSNLSENPTEKIGHGLQCLPTASPCE